MHTSRDIRSVASQLVSMWIEVFRKEKAINGLKILRQATGLEPSKVRPKDLTLGKPHLRETSESRCNVLGSLSSGSYSPSKANDKKAEMTTTQLESLGIKFDVKSLHSQRLVHAEPKLNDCVVVSEEEVAALATAEAARAAALKAAEVF